MKSYIILRSNYEYGPFSVEELKSVFLQPHDLIWKEGTSTRWHHSSELEELTDIAVNTGQENSLPISDRIILPSKTASRSQINTERSVTLTPEDVEAYYAQRLQERKYIFERRYDFRTGLSSLSAAFWIGGLLTGLLVSAFVIKKIVDSFDNTTPESSIAADTVPAVQAANAPANSSSFLYSSQHKK